MMQYIRFVFGLLLSLLIGASAFAQDASERSDLTINDLAGHWEIEVIDRPDHTFKGTAVIPRVKEDGKSVVAETITEDRCCGGNHARVLQDSHITIEGDEITVDSTIARYLLRVEPYPARYSPDNFKLRWEDRNTLIGTANGYLPVRWIRGELNIS